MRTLGQIIEVATRTGEPQIMTTEEWEKFRADFAASIGPDIERIRAEQIRAFVECQHLVMD
jgi:hypothetical protein